MFYYLLSPVLSVNWVLIAAAVIPALFLMVKVYKSDRLEAEKPEFLFRMATAGVLATLIALVEEWVGEEVLSEFISEYDPLYNVILYFIIVGLAEESSKYLLLKRRSWKSAEFNCQYDGVVYAVFVSLGFALWENISYVLHYGFSTALIRAVTAIPGHACFGVFMGVFYGLARSYAFLGDDNRSRRFRILSVVVPTVLHGAYDYIASMETDEGTIFFFVFIAVLFAVSLWLINRMSKNDRYFQIDRRSFTGWE